MNEATKQTAKAWLWPDRTIGKRESGTLREEHNATVNAHADLLEACQMALGQLDEWGRGDNEENVYANNAEVRKIVMASIAKAKGEDPS